MKLLIGVDLGTTGIRSIVYNERLECCGEDYNEYPLILLSEDYIEQDADVWWEQVKKSIVAAMEKGGNSGRDVAGISISSQGISFLAVDQNGQPMMRAINWLDRRATAEVEEVLKHFSERQIYEITGKRVDSAYVLPKLLWLKNREPMIFNNAAHFVMAHDFIVAKLCGNYITDYTMASGTMLFDISKRCWSQKLMGRFGIEEAKLPRVMAAGSKAGVILPHVAGELGLNEDVIVSVGGQDQKCAALGAGIADEIITVSLGTAAAITKRWSMPRFDEQMRIPCFADIIEDCWVTEGVVSTATSSLKWLRDAFFPNKSYDELDEMVNGMYTKDLFFYPFLSGVSTPSWYSNGCGCYYGIRLNTRPADMIQAIFEGVAFQIRENIEIMQDYESMAIIQSLRVFGGGARSKPWCQTIANITGIPVYVPNTVETACVGAAMLAGVCSGVFTNLCQAQDLVTISNKYNPDFDIKLQYDTKYKKYLEIEKKLWG